jgi:predicted transcriptional regulator of viral defense system
VVVPQRAIRPIAVGNVRIRFHGKGPFRLSGTMAAKTPTGSMRISDAETTAWDLVRYNKDAGGLQNVITVLSELANRLDPRKLGATVRRHGEVIVAQRLGHLLERIDRRDLTRMFGAWVADAPVRPLDPAEPVDDAAMERTWRLLVNAELEPEA